MAEPKADLHKNIGQNVPNIDISLSFWLIQEENDISNIHSRFQNHTSNNPSKTVPQSFYIKITTSDVGTDHADGFGHFFFVLRWQIKIFEGVITTPLCKTIVKYPSALSLTPSPLCWSLYGVWIDKLSVNGIWTVDMYGFWTNGIDADLRGYGILMLCNGFFGHLHYVIWTQHHLMWINNGKWT